ncbi:polymer-forming cytoskeletal protein [Saprospiraceae bacterium]|jgi:cytoskeletal protein CcmA (bactofilin family)|nr:polymer-forming cytoskeletal protein [Saprospiraceae bacterium]MDC3210796.1 polymer-forming cytoskeletal protein [Saprospiraceae bacterium]MDC3253575.1 polymer-forming cytoskeletal protein [bacterium]MDG1434715.1 polymer-forming cytoskeletal protein [Saprospiraceae bacterium]
MFNSKKNDSTLASNNRGSAPSGASNALNSLVKGTKVEGTVSSESDIRIDGIIVGTLNCKSKVIIGPTGAIEGDVKCENAVIEGRFEGNLKVNQLLTVKDSAEVHGDVNTNKLLVQSGAIFNVTCSMGANQNKIDSSPIGKMNQENQKKQSFGQKATQKVG